jgi:hypothetical protein
MQQSAQAKRWHDEFVWVQTERGAVPEKWPADAPAGVMVDKRVVARRPLGSGEFALSLDELAKKYPAPVLP